ncbi:hypothetical protein [Mesorhizobium sp.]|uniref:hypothetical protein n=1 Tax=Mesorhizobium sp. TaxID=1871066 RepID=UPI00257D4C84|nr:hypothetical protein [Mesorhizobium sp.]
MSAFSLSSDRKLAITASETSSKNDFDYLVGNWNIRNRTLKEPLAGSDEWEEFDATQEFRQILVGLGNFDIFHTELGGKPFEGLTVRLFDPKTRLWTIYWADSNAGKLDDGKVGSFNGDEGEFFGREVVAGKDVIVKFHWDKRNPKPRFTAVHSPLMQAERGNGIGTRSFHDGDRLSWPKQNAARSRAAKGSPEADSYVRRVPLARA